MTLSKNIDIQKAIKLYRDEKIPLTALSKIIGCSIGTLVSRLRDYGVLIRSHGNHMEKVKLEDIKYDYEILKLSTTEIAKKYNMSSVSIWERLKNNGVIIRDRKDAVFSSIHKIPLSEHKKICELYLKDNSQNCGKIAKLYNVHKTTIADILKKNGIKLENNRSRNPAWKGGITPLHTKIRNSLKYEEWRTKCFKRDNYICVVSGCSGNLNVHHIKSFSKIFEEFLCIHKDATIKENALLDLAFQYEPFWDINNGITVCEKIHKYLHKNQIDFDLVKKIKSMYLQNVNKNKISKELKISWYKVDRIIRIVYN